MGSAIRFPGPPHRMASIIFLELSDARITQVLLIQNQLITIEFIVSLLFQRPMRLCQSIGK